MRPSRCAWHAAKRGAESHRSFQREIRRQALLAMVNEEALLLAEAVASRANDIDVVMMREFGFPR